jgi:Protein of unknown function (DUF2934)
MLQDRSQQIRERAHSLWERDGRPEGLDQAHWHEAERQIAAESNRSTSASAVGKPKVKGTASKPKAVEAVVNAKVAKTAKPSAVAEKAKVKEKAAKPNGKPEIFSKPAEVASTKRNRGAAAAKMH